jgi:chromosome segregation ATPase
LPSDNVIALHSTEIAKLRAENLSMSTSIQKLESTVVQLTGNFRTLTQTNKDQLAEIDILRSENKQLQQGITALTNALEKQNSGSAAQEQNSSGLKLKMFGNI